MITFSSFQRWPQKYPLPHTLFLHYDFNTPLSHWELWCMSHPLKLGGFLLLWPRLKWKWGYAFHNASSYKAIHHLPCVCACLLAQLCLTLCNLYSLANYSPSGSSAHGIFQARILEWITNSFFGGSSQHRDRTHISYVSCIGRQILYLWAT